MLSFVSLTSFTSLSLIHRRRQGFLTVQVAYVLEYLSTLLPRAKCRATAGKTKLAVSSSAMYHHLFSPTNNTSDTLGPAGRVFSACLRTTRARARVRCAMRLARSLMSGIGISWRYPLPRAMPRPKKTRLKARTAHNAHNQNNFNQAENTTCVILFSQWQVRFLQQSQRA
jgi:hypothetical protein